MTDSREPGLPEPTLPCGLYRTTKPIDTDGDVVEANLLVKFHNHSESGGAVIHLPHSNTGNRWSFDRKAIAVDGDTDGLVELRAEGLWRMREHFHPTDGQVVHKNALVQLGYNRAAQPILFFPTPIEGANGFAFPDRGTRVPPAIYDLLEPLDIRGPVSPRKLH